MNLDKIQIAETEDYDALVELFVKNELEFSVNDEVPTDLVKLWKAETTQVTSTTDSKKNTLIGGCVLALREEEYIIDGIAVEPEFRAEKLGQTLLQLAIKEVKSRGGKWLYLVARAPEFFRKQGFITIEREDAPNFFECLTCLQYGKNCFPEVMKLEIK